MSFHANIDFKAAPGLRFRGDTTQRYIYRKTPEQETIHTSFELTCIWHIYDDFVDPQEGNTLADREIKQLYVLAEKSQDHPLQETIKRYYEQRGANNASQTLSKILPREERLEIQKLLYAFLHVGLYLYGWKTNAPYPTTTRNSRIVDPVGTDMVINRNLTQMKRNPSFDTFGEFPLIHNERTWYTQDISTIQHLLEILTDNSCENNVIYASLIIKTVYTYISSLGKNSLPPHLLSL